ncbi:MAG: hypothetical protein Q8R39_04075, partial [bacterium]|nr:hypothetical protein [bacterium]
MNIKRVLYRAASAAALYGMPLLAGAQLNADATAGFKTVSSVIIGIVDVIIPVVFAIGLIFFLWGLLKFLTAGGDEDATASAKHLMVWGVVILFVMTAVWGLVGVLNQLTGFSGAPVPAGPGIPTPR